MQGTKCDSHDRMLDDFREWLSSNRPCGSNTALLPAKLMEIDQDMSCHLPFSLPNWKRWFNLWHASWALSCWNVQVLKFRQNYIFPLIHSSKIVVLKNLKSGNIIRRLVQVSLINPCICGPPAQADDWKHPLNIWIPFLENWWHSLLSTQICWVSRYLWN